MSSNEDPHTGGSLSNMAVTGTTMPNDAGKYNTIPSVPRPDQVTDPNSLGASSLASAADNPTDINRSTKDKAAQDDVLTGTGDTLPAEIGTKRLYVAGNPDLSKGHARYDKHVQQKGSDQERGAATGAEAEEEEVVDGVVGER